MILGNKLAKGGRDDVAPFVAFVIKTRFFRKSELHSVQNDRKEDRSRLASAAELGRKL
jgi:hypothetical protein